MVTSSNVVQMWKMLHSGVLVFILECKKNLQFKSFVSDMVNFKLY